MMLTNLAIGDAFGIAWEFVKAADEGNLVNDGRTYQQNPRYPELKPSQYTDDTLRSIATARVVLDPTLDAFSPLTYIGAIQQVYREDKRPGWSKRFQALLAAHENSTPLELAKAITKRLDSNGSLMGCLPVGFLSTPVEVMLAAAAQALATHSVDTIPYAQALALTVFHFRHGGTSRTLHGFLLDHVGDIGDYSITPPKWTQMSAAATTHAVLHIIGSTETRSHTERLKWAVDLRGDTDSVGALVLALSSLDAQTDPDLDPQLSDLLDFGTGSARLDELSARLIKLS